MKIEKDVTIVTGETKEEEEKDRNKYIWKMIKKEWTKQWKGR